MYEGSEELKKRLVLMAHCATICHHPAVAAHINPFLQIAAKAEEEQYLKLLEDPKRWGFGFASGKTISGNETLIDSVEFDKAITRLWVDQLQPIDEAIKAMKAQHPLCSDAPGLPYKGSCDNVRQASVGQVVYMPARVRNTIRDVVPNYPTLHIAAENEPTKTRAQRRAEARKK